MNKNFEPYIDWDSVSQEMSDDLHKKLVEHKKNLVAFEEKNTPENCAAVLRTQFELTNLSSALHQTLFTVPVMVHVAGEKTNDVDPQGHDSITQRCTRCGSVLQRWCEAFAVLTPAGLQHITEDELPWWKPGDIVAKATDDDMMTTYQIEKGNDLDKNEKECVDLSSLDLLSPDAD